MRRSLPGTHSPPSDYCIQHNLRHCLRGTSHTEEDILILRTRERTGRRERERMSISRWIIQGSRSFLKLYREDIACELAGFSVDRAKLYMSVCMRVCTYIPRECWRWNNSWRKRDGHWVTKRESMSRWRRRFRPRRFRHRENREAVSTGEGLFLLVMDYRGISQYS